MQMRAVVLEQYGAPEVMKVREVPVPQPGREDLLVRVTGTALNRADLLQRRGAYPQPGRKPEHEIPGIEFAGTVEAIGADVARFKPGDRVFGLLTGGGYAEYVTTHERTAMPVPDGLSWTEAAAVPEAYVTAYDALFSQAELRHGSTVLIHAGGSGVGTAAIQLCKLMGARVFTTVGSAEKAERVRQLGADRPINYRTEDFGAVIKAETAGNGVDVIIDFIGAPYLERNVSTLGFKGRMVILGLMGGPAAEISLRAIMAKRLRVMGSTLRARALEEKAALAQAFAKEMLPLFGSGRLKPVIDSVFPLEQVVAAHQYMEANRNFGKIVLQVAES